MQKIAIFGASGNTGTQAVRHALKTGKKVTVLLRDPSRLESDLHDTVTIVQGDVLQDYDKIQEVVANQDAVCVVLGTRNSLEPTEVHSKGTENIIKAMKEQGVKVLSACMSAFLFREPDKVPPQFVHLNGDHQKQLDIIKASGLQFIAVLPPHITSDEGEKLKILHNESPGGRISKTALGAFLIDSLGQPEHYGQICGISDSPKAS